MLKTKKQITLIFSILCILLLTSCGSNLVGSNNKLPDINKDTKFDLLGTVISISSYDSITDDIFEHSFSLVEDIEQLLSVNIDSSEISTINNSKSGEYISVSDETYNLIQQSLEFSRLSNGAFDISIEPVMNLWKTDGDFTTKPEDEAITQALSRVNYKDIILKDSKVMLMQDGMQLDLGGIAKGYACDVTLDYLKSQNINNALLDFGGNIYAHGRRPDGNPWTIGIRSPQIDSSDLVCTIGVEDSSVVTSGGYERYFVEDDTVYHHIIDPKTGYPANNELLSVTIIDSSSTRADALSTTCFILGLEKGFSLLSSLEGSDGVFITRDLKVYVTDGLAGQINLVDTNYELIQPQN